MACGAALTMLTSCQRESEAAAAGDYPRKPVKVIVPFATGGGSDTFARLVQKTIRDEGLLPHPLVILNVPGAGGTIGSRRVKDALADGYTILNLHEGIFSAKHSGQAPYGPEAFTPIAGTGKSAMVLCVAEDSPYRDLRDLLRGAAERPDGILFGMAPGTPSHFTGLKLEKAVDGARFRYVASGGGAKRLHDLIGGHIEVSPFSLAEYAGFRSEGLRALACFDEARHPDAPEIPTAREQGYPLVLTNVQYWWAPKGTPPEVVGRLAEAFEAAMRSDTLADTLRGMQVDPIVLRDDELAADLRTRESEYEGVALVNYRNLPPVSLAVGLAVALLGIGAVVQWARGRTAPVAPADPPAPRRGPLLTLFVLAIYILGLQRAGLPFAWATLIFVPALGALAGARSPRHLLSLLLLGGVLGGGCVLLFTRVLVTDLP